MSANNTVIQHKRGRAATWIEKNPILAKGEIGIEYDTGRAKAGDGTRHWNELTYIGQEIYSTHVVEDFPEIGNVDIIYRACNEKTLYQWNDIEKKYEPLNNERFDLNTIKIINGGNAECQN